MLYPGSLWVGLQIVLQGQLVLQGHPTTSGAVPNSYLHFHNLCLLTTGLIDDWVSQSMSFQRSVLKSMVKLGNMNPWERMHPIRNTALGHHVWEGHVPFLDLALGGPCSSCDL